MKTLKEIVANISTDIFHTKYEPQTDEELISNLKEYGEMADDVVEGLCWIASKSPNFEQAGEQKKKVALEYLYGIYITSKEALEKNNVSLDE